MGSEVVHGGLFCGRGRYVCLVHETSSILGVVGTMGWLAASGESSGNNRAYMRARKAPVMARTLVTGIAATGGEIRDLDEVGHIEMNRLPGRRLLATDRRRHETAAQGCSL